MRAWEISKHPPSVDRLSHHGSVRKFIGIECWMLGGLCYLLFGVWGMVFGKF